MDISIYCERRNLQSILQATRIMPKMKSHRGLAKRVKKTGTGKLKRHHAYTSHRFHGKTKDQRRHLAKAGMVSKSDMKRIKEMLVK